jgi:small subunit ribosomal protein S1
MKLPNLNNSSFLKVLEGTNPFAGGGAIKTFRDDDEEPGAKSSFEEMFEKSLEQQESGLSEGQMVNGKVVAITPEKVLVDVGYKSEGEVNTSQFRLPDGTLEIAVGDEIQVIVERMENENGLLQLSKNKADMFRAWDEIAVVCEQNQVIEGTVTEVVKGGLMVDIGIKAFLPGSQVDVRPLKNLEQFLGQTLRFKVLKYNRKRGNVVLSRRAVVESERDSLKVSTLKQLKVGAIVRGTVKNITDYGAFIDLGGVDGLLHITDISWGRIKHPSDVLKVGQEVNVRVLKFDQEKERVSLGMKQTLPDPWANVSDRFFVGQRITGKVVSITDYGAFIEVEPGIEGLIHVSEMSWTQRVKDPRKLLEVDQSTEAVILDIDHENRRMSLGLKQITANPWDSLEFKYPTGTKVKGTIKNVTDFGIFVEIEEGIDGLVHVSDLSWDQKVTHPKQLFEKGQEVEAMVMNIDKGNERISLSIKNLSRDPWANYIDSHPVHSVVEGAVTKLANFGAFVELSEGVEGMVHISELSDERIMHPEAVVKVGDRIKVEIVNVDQKDRKISLSVKSLAKREERENLEGFRSRQAESSRSSIADSISPELAKKLGLLGSVEKQPSDGE